MPRPLVYVVGGFGVGGTERHLSLVLPRLDQGCWQTHVVGLGPDGPFSEPLRAAGLDVRPVVVKPPFSRVPKLRAFAFLIAQVQAVRAAVQSINPAIVHCFLPTPCIVGWLAHRGHASRLVMSRRAQRASPQAFTGERFLEVQALRHADAVVGHSTEVVSELRADGVAQQRLHLIPNGIDTVAFPGRESRAELRAREGYAADEVVWICVANLIPYKGHEELIDALALQSASGPRWRALFVGHGEDLYEASLRERVAAHGLESRISFLGRRSDVASLLVAADAAVLASHHEGFSNAVLEYMAAGLPVVATAVGGNRDAIEDGSTGMLVEPRDAQALAEAVATLTADAKLRQTMGAAACKRVAETYALESVVRRYEKLYDELIDA